MWLSYPLPTQTEAQEVGTGGLGGQAGFGKGQPSLKCEKPSQETQEATSRAKLKLMANSPPGLLSEDGEFRYEATDRKPRKQVRGRLFKAKGGRQSLGDS